MGNSPGDCGPGGQWLGFIFIWWGIVLMESCPRTPVVAMVAMRDCSFELVDNPPYFLMWHHLTIFCSPTRKQNHCPGETGLPSSLFGRKETTQLVSGKVEFNECQVSMLWHNSFLSQPK